MTHALTVPNGPPILLPEPCISTRLESACHPITGCSAALSFFSDDPQWLSSCFGSDDDWTRGKVWEGGEILARELLARPYLVRGLRVVECGAGTGIVGLAAAAAGAKDVTMTDASLDAAEASVRVNPSLASRISLRPLRWGDAAASAALAPPFDLVLAADVVHPQNAAALDPLLESMRSLAGVAGATRAPFALLSYIERSTELTERLDASLRALPARCRRRALGRRAWLFTLDRWEAWPTGTSCSEEHEEMMPAAAGSAAAGGSARAPKRLVPGFRRSFNAAD